MTTVNESLFISLSLEGFLYGKTCALTCTLDKEVQLFLGIGLYSGIFTIYLLLSSSKKFRTTIIILYVLATATFVSDLGYLILYVSNNPICKSTFFLSAVQTRAGALPPQLQIGLQPMIFRVLTVQATANACCDFLAQCILVRMKNCTCHPLYWPESSKIYRCWIVWGKDIRVVIIPSFLAIAYLRQWFYLHLISRFHVIASSSLARATWLIFICTRHLNLC